MAQQVNANHSINPELSKEFLNYLRQLPEDSPFIAFIKPSGNESMSIQEWADSLEKDPAKLQKWTTRYAAAKKRMNQASDQ